MKGDFVLGLPRPSIAWAKLVRAQTGGVLTWHSLVDHSADVAACFEAALGCPVVAARLASLAGRSVMPPLWIARLCVLASLHDFGKANRGFQARWNEKAPFVGHCREALAAVSEGGIRRELERVLPLADIMQWCEVDDLILSPLAHHGIVSQEVV